VTAPSKAERLKAAKADRDAAFQALAEAARALDKAARAWAEADRVWVEADRRVQLIEAEP